MVEISGWTLFFSIMGGLLAVDILKELLRRIFRNL
jgi:hypothetical protein